MLSLGARNIVIERLPAARHRYCAAKVLSIDSIIFSLFQDVLRVKLQLNNMEKPHWTKQYLEIPGVQVREIIGPKRRNTKLPPAIFKFQVC
jgi:hypothetical protein